MDKQKSVSNRILFRVYMLFAVFVLLGFVLVSRIFYLQLNSQQWDKIDKEERFSLQRISADRGNILSENGTILATSLPFYKIALDPGIIDTTKFVNFNDSLKVLSHNLYHLIGRFEGERDTSLHMDSLFYYKRVREAMKLKSRHVYVVRRILNYKEYKTAITFPVLNKTRKDGGGIIVEKFNNKRFYPYGEMGRVTLGTLNNDSAGIRGIEYSCNEYLQGKDGYFMAHKIAGNHYIPIDDFSKADSEDGYDVVTTIDEDLQDIVERALEKGVLGNHAKWGTAILMEVKTGKIKAIANYPEKYNHAIAELIEPGSTFKLASALAALEAHVVTPDDSLDTGEGMVVFGDKEIKDDHPIGKVPYRTVFAKSSNVGISLTTVKGFEKQPERFIEYLDNFGFKESVIQQFKGEPQPVLTRPGTPLWSGTSLPSMSIGYSVLITPLQLLTFYNAVANQGKYIKPYILSKVIDNSLIIKDLVPKPYTRQICSHANASKAREMMEGVVEYGTAKEINGTPFKIAGKTGTARKSINGQYVSRYRASFAGFFPSDKPVYSLIVVVDEPAGGSIYGADVAAPVFKEIAEKVYTLDREVLGTLEKISPEPITNPAPKIMRASVAREIYTEMGIETSGVPESEWIASKGNDGHQISFRTFGPAGIMPDMRGMSARDALNLLEQMKVKVSLSGVGKVRRQSLAPGAKLFNGSTVSLYLD